MHAVVESPTAGGFSTADLLALIAIVVTLFGLLLTAIGVLLLRLLGGLDARLTRVEARIDLVQTTAANDTAGLRRDLGRDIGALWNAVNGRNTPPPTATARGT